MSIDEYNTVSTDFMDLGNKIIDLNKLISVTKINRPDDAFYAVCLRFIKGSEYEYFATLQEQEECFVKLRSICRRV